MIIILHFISNPSDLQFKSSIIYGLYKDYTQASLSGHESPVYGLYCCFKILVLGADDYVHLGRALVYHTDVDVTVGEGGENGRRGALTGRHIVADGGDEGESAVYLDVVRIERGAEFADKALGVVGEIFVADDERERVYA